MSELRASLYPSVPKRGRALGGFETWVSQLGLVPLPGSDLEAPSPFGQLQDGFFY